MSIIIERMRELIFVFFLFFFFCKYKLQKKERKKSSIKKIINRLKPSEHTKEQRYPSILCVIWHFFHVTIDKHTQYKSTKYFGTKFMPYLTHCSTTVNVLFRFFLFFVLLFLLNGNKNKDLFFKRMTKEIIWGSLPIGFIVKRERLNLSLYVNLTRIRRTRSQSRLFYRFTKFTHGPKWEMKKIVYRYMCIFSIIRYFQLRPSSANRFICSLNKLARCNYFDSGGNFLLNIITGKWASKLRLFIWERRKKLPPCFIFFLFCVRLFTAFV